jgi:hypothetical protein
MFATRFKDSKDPFRIVIVRDMWLTGFDAPCLHTMYATVDWTQREGAQAKIRVVIKRILRQFGYPPDLQDAAVKEVLPQAALLCAEVAT